MSIRNGHADADPGARPGGGSALTVIDAERAAIADVVQRHNDVLETNIAMADRAEIPVPARVREIGVPAEDAYRAITVPPPCVLHVRVENARAEFADELDVIDALVAEVARVVVEPEALVALHRFDRALG